MDFGIVLGQHLTEIGQTSFKQLMERVRIAEDLGFDLVCLGDRHLWPGGFHEILTTMSALAPVTTRIRICSSGFILPIYNPILLAEQMAHLDLISGGRLIFGVVLGYREEELAISDVESRYRVGRLREGLEIISRLWAGESLTFQGQHYQCRDAQIAPLPLQKPHPPIWIGGTAEPALKRAARLADGWIPSASLSQGELREKIRIYRNSLEELGREGTLVVPRLGFVARTRSQARTLVEGPLLSQYRRYAAWMKDTPEGDRYRHLELEAFQDKLILGAPDECVDQVAVYQELGADIFVYHCQHEGISQREMIDSMELFARHVMPQFDRS